MKTFNQLILVGYVSKPELADEITKKPLKFTIVTKRPGYTKQDGTVVEEVPQYHRCVCFGKLGVTAGQYLLDKDLALVEGEILYNEYVDKTGVKRLDTNILVNNLTILHHKNDLIQRSQQQQQQQMPSTGQQMQQIMQQQYQQPVQYQQQYQPQQYQPQQNNGGNPPF